MDEILIVPLWRDEYGHLKMRCPFRHAHCSPKCSHWRGIRPLPLATLCYNNEYEIEMLKRKQPKLDKNGK